MTNQVFRTAAIPNQDFATTWMKRGLSPKSVAALAFAVRGVKLGITSLTELIDKSFEPTPGYKTPFRSTRYGDGSYPVFYSALEESTSIAEVGYHFVKQALSTRLPRFYWVFACDFSGSTIDIVGRENQHPELVSEDDSGYPFCRGIAQKLRSRVDAIRAPSARLKPDGICAAIFTREAISNPTPLYSVCFILDGTTFRKEIV